MALFGTSMTTLNDLFVHTMRTTYYAEKQIVSALEKMADKAMAPELRDAFLAHRAESQEQVRRLEQVFAMHDEPAKETSCPAFDGISKANDAEASDAEQGPVRDAALAGGAQLVEHYEIAQYGKMIAWARALGRDDCAGVLEQTLAEEKATDERLTRLAEGGLNRAAVRTQTA